MKLSIITINYNNAEGLRKTMESVFAQTSKGFEYIVIDGASSDDSVDIIKEYAQKLEIGDCKLENLQWISEPDSGIYEAMNKGLKMCHGEYTLMLNSGDYLVDEHVVDRIIPELHSEDIIQGNLIEDMPDKRIRNRGYGRTEISFIDALGGYILHQAAFIRMSVHEKYGYYDDLYKKNADTYFFINALALGNATFRYVDIDIANFDMHGITHAGDPRWKLIAEKENARWYAEHIPNRMTEIYQTAPAKIRLYDVLHRHKFIWKLAMGLVRISEWLSPSEPQIKKEEIKS